MAGSSAITTSTITEADDTLFCDNTLREVLSWLDVPQLLSSAALVSRRWASAAACKEVFRRRMHPALLDGLFSAAAPPAPAPAPPSAAAAAPAAAVISTGDGDQAQEQELLLPVRISHREAAAAALARAGVSPARLFAALYGGNLLCNGAFLERANVAKSADGTRHLAWEPTLHTRGMTWAHPFDFPELCPLPNDAAASGSNDGGGSSSPARRRSSSGGSSSKPFSVGCLATSTGAWSEVTQVLELPAALAARGVPGDAASWLLTSGLSVELSAFVAGGAMAGGEYQIVLILVTADDAAAAANNGLQLAALPKAVLPLGHPPPGSPGAMPVAAANLQALGLRGGSRLLTREPLQPAPGVWSPYTCRTALPRGALTSHVVVALRGRASRTSRLGHYAAKFANARLAILSADEQECC